MKNRKNREKLLIAVLISALVFGAISPVTGDATTEDAYGSHIGGLTVQQYNPFSNSWFNVYQKFHSNYGGQQYEENETIYLTPSWAIRYGLDALLNNTFAENRTELESVVGMGLNITGDITYLNPVLCDAYSANYGGFWHYSFITTAPDSFTAENQTAYAQFIDYYYNGSSWLIIDTWKVNLSTYTEPESGGGYGDDYGILEDFETWNSNSWSFFVSANTSNNQFNFNPESALAKKTGTYGGRSWINQTVFGGLVGANIWKDIHGDGLINASYWRVEFDFQLAQNIFTGQDSGYRFQMFSIGELYGEFETQLIFDNATGTSDELFIKLRYENRTWDYVYLNSSSPVVEVGTWQHYRFEAKLSNTTDGFYRLYIDEELILDTGLIDTVPELAYAETDGYYAWDTVELGLQPYRWYVLVDGYYDNFAIYTNTYTPAPTATADYTDFIIGLTGILIMVGSPSWFAVKLRDGLRNADEIIQRFIFALLLFVVGYCLILVWLGGYL